MTSKRPRVAFLFLGETLLIPHLYPIVEALAARDEADIDLWVATSTHEAMLTRWTRDQPHVRVRRAPGFRPLADDDARNPPLPAKLPMLLRLLPRLMRADAVVCAEQTSLWLPRLFPFAPPFVKTSHGVGSMSARDDPRRRAAWALLVPSERERETYLTRGFAPDRVVATGYVKAAFRQRTQRTHITLPFAESRPVILYTPHWQLHRSSWWDWGSRIVDRLVADGRWNVILAPHQRLVERAPEVRAVLARVAHLPHVHCDLDSFAGVDGSYTAAADLYLGDTSSQVIEFLIRPRPCIFLNPARVAWADDPAYAQWTCGEVVETLDDALPALERAPARHPAFARIQAAFAADSLGDLSGEAPIRAADWIMTAVRSSGWRSDKSVRPELVEGHGD